MSVKTDRRLEADEWTTEAFLEHFMRVHEQMPERHFAFILGAGASVSSGIVSGAKLVDVWLDELKRRDPQARNCPTSEWATASTLDIDDFQYKHRAEFYPQVYERRFGDDPDEGYAYLEDVMKQAEPSLGYSMLAQVLAQSRHKVVITTNFDNLVSDALLLFTSTFAQICGHESLTSFIRLQPRRPLVAKVHRDLLLGPQSDPYQTNLLHEDWARTLRSLFQHYTPLVIGYGGNDGSLMGFLNSLKSKTMPGGIFWFYLHEGAKPNRRIQALVTRHAGKLVAILDFDVFMCQLADRLGFGLLDAELEQRCRARAMTLRREWGSVKDAIEELAKSQPDDRSRQGAQRTMEDVEKRRVDQEDHWYSWVLRAKRERQPPAARKIFVRALRRFPKHAGLTREFAIFMHETSDDHDETERLYREALKLDPNCPVLLGKFATFLWDVRRQYNEAESHYRHALELDPEDVEIT